MSMFFCITRLALCALTLASIAADEVDTRARTVFVPRALTSYSALMCPAFSSPRFSLSHSVIYQHATGLHKLNPYFFGGERDSLSVAEDGTGDVNPEWFHITTKNGDGEYDDGVDPYASEISLIPSRSLTALVTTCTVPLTLISPALSLRVVLPLTSISHALHVTEIGAPQEVSEAAAFTSMAEALDNSNWRAGRISQKSLSYAGAGDILCEVEHVSSLGEAAKVVFGAHLVIPTAAPVSHRFLFAPAGGNNGHWAGGASCEIARSFPMADTFQLVLSSRASLTYLVGDREVRILDRIGQPFSRYLVTMRADETLVNMNRADDLVGRRSSNNVNMLARDYFVSPGNTGTLTNRAALTYKNHSGGFMTEVWWRQGEDVTGADVPLDNRSFATPRPDGATGSEVAWIRSPRIAQEWINDFADTSQNTVIAYESTPFSDEATAGSSPAQSLTAGLFYRGLWNMGAGVIGIELTSAYEYGVTRGALSHYMVCGALSCAW